MLVTIDLRTSPKLGHQLLSDVAENFHLIMEIQSEDLQRLTRTIKHRNMVHYVHTHHSEC